MAPNARQRLELLIYRVPLAWMDLESLAIGLQFFIFSYSKQ
jgi:hypothetical protein